MNLNKIEEDTSKIIELYQLGRYQECLFLSEKILEIDANNFDVLAHTASSYSHLGEYKKAIVFFSKCLVIDSEKFYIWVLRGDAFYELQKYNNAFSDYWISLQFEPENGAVLDKIARTLFRLGDENKALEYIQKAIQIGNSPEPILVMMVMLNKLGAYGFIEPISKVGIEKFPERKDDFIRYSRLDFLKN
jgi:tetratricopeptide (TPR) repeat protein